MVTVAGRSIEVLAVDGRAITEVRISPRRDGTPSDRALPGEGPDAGDVPAAPASSDTRHGGPGVASGTA